MTGRIPVDSAEARELAEQRQALEHERLLRQRDHETRCARGWLGDDDEGRPIPCLICHPQLLEPDCRSCYTTSSACSTFVNRGQGRCCSGCRHERSSA